MSIMQCLWIWMTMSSLTVALVQNTKDSLVFGVLSKKVWVEFQVKNITQLSVCLCGNRETQCSEGTAKFRRNKSISNWRTITRKENLETEDNYYSSDTQPVIANNESTNKVAYFSCEYSRYDSRLVCSREMGHSIPCQIKPCSVNLVLGCSGDTSATLVWKNSQQARVYESPNKHIQDCCGAAHTTTPISLYDDPALNTSVLKPTDLSTVHSPKRSDSDNEISYTSLITSLLSSLVYGDLQDTLIETQIGGMFIFSENTTRILSDTDLDSNQSIINPVVDTKKTSFYLTNTHIGIIATGVIVPVLAIIIIGIIWRLKSRTKHQRANKDNIEQQTHVNSFSHNLAQTSGHCDKFDHSYPCEFKKFAEPSVDAFSHFLDQSPNLNDFSITTNAGNLSPTESLEVNYSTVTKKPSQRTGAADVKSTKKITVTDNTTFTMKINENKPEPEHTPLASSFLQNSQDSSHVELESYPSTGDDSNHIYWKLGERDVIRENLYNTLSSDDDIDPSLFQFTTLRFADLNLALNQIPPESKPCQNSSSLKYITVYPQCSSIITNTSNNKTNNLPVVYANIACNGTSKVEKDLVEKDAIIASERNENNAANEVLTSDTKVNISSQNNDANIDTLYLNTAVITNKTPELSHSEVRPDFNDVIYANTY